MRPTFLLKRQTPQNGLNFTNKPFIDEIPYKTDVQLNEYNQGGGEENEHKMW